jgi:secondary thiamine-phosphate synthase enzyme
LTVRRAGGAMETLELHTKGRGFIDITRDVARAVERSGVKSGVCIVFCPHTSCSLLIQENADPSVQRDLLAWLERLAPDEDERYEHVAEGPGDMASHLRTALLRTNEMIPVVHGRLALGTWQGVYLVEHRLEPHTRKVVVVAVPEDPASASAGPPR